MLLSSYDETLFIRASLASKIILKCLNSQIDSKIQTNIIKIWRFIHGLHHLNHLISKLPYLILELKYCYVFHDETKVEKGFKKQKERKSIMKERNYET